MAYRPRPMMIHFFAPVSIAPPSGGAAGAFVGHEEIDSRRGDFEGMRRIRYDGELRIGRRSLDVLAPSSQSMTESSKSPETVQTQCCVVGGGPAGMMLGLLLARAGVEVVVLEKHADFFRDFRGDTIHPSTLELMAELGFLEEFLGLPHTELHKIGATVNGHEVTMADFSHLPTRCKFIALMPQWDFLNFISEKARRYPTFRLRMEAEATDLIMADGRVAGVSAKTPGGELQVRADLVIGADGRQSTMRTKAGLEVMEFGVPIDVLWLRLPRLTSDPEQSLGHFRNGRLMVMLDRGDYWQCAVIIPKGGYDKVRQGGLPAFQDHMLKIVPFLGERVRKVAAWDDVKLLTVQINRVREWARPGLLCIGDAAHAMSPAGGVGINLAIQDAVAASNLLAEKLRTGSARLEDLRGVQERRELPTRLIQAMQVFIHRRVSGGPPGEIADGLPLPVRIMRSLPFFTRIPARVVGLGFRPEHVRTAEFQRAN
jgi:2-polyprenyl-6-methoxyphenol hydroxylase-like FAD-dependent oxidoreductase